jgi:glutathione synthase/RimK-type ligase-like ATP-grasp enzyme
MVNYGNSNLNTQGYNLIVNRPEVVRRCIDKPEALRILREQAGGDLVVPNVVTGCLLVKRRHHRGGIGHTLVDGAETYAEEFVPCTHEWRVHVVGDRTCARLKSGGHGSIRNLRNGWAFTYSPDVPQPVRDAGIVAVRLLSLDFGAVDVGYRERATPVVYEVNTAPRLQVDTVLDWYEEKLINLIERRLRRG